MNELILFLISLVFYIKKIVEYYIIKDLFKLWQDVYFSSNIQQYTNLYLIIKHHITHSWTGFNPDTRYNKVILITLFGI